MGSETTTKNGKNTEAIEKHMAALSDLMGGRGVRVWSRLIPVLAPFIPQAAPAAAILASQILYRSIPVLTKETDGWVNLPTAQAEIETGLSIENQRAARRVFERSGIIEFRKHGSYWYRPVWNRLADLLNPHGSTSDLPYIGTTDLRNSGTTELPFTQHRDSRGRYIGTTDVNTEGPLKESLKDSLNDSKQDSSSWSPNGHNSKDEEEEGKRKVEFSNDLIEGLEEIGVYKNLLPEIAASGWTEDQIFDLIDEVRAEAQQDDRKNPAALLVHRIRNRKPGKTKTSREPDYRRFLDDEYAPYTNH